MWNQSQLQETQTWEELAGDTVGLLCWYLSLIWHSWLLPRSSRSVAVALVEVLLHSSELLLWILMLFLWVGLLWSCNVSGIGNLFWLSPSFSFSAILVLSWSSYSWEKARPGMKRRKRMHWESILGVRRRHMDCWLQRLVLIAHRGKFPLMTEYPLCHTRVFWH